MRTALNPTTEQCTQTESHRLIPTSVVSPSLWRLTRNRYGRAIYDFLAQAGITATAMREYVADLPDDTTPEIDHIIRTDDSLHESACEWTSQSNPQFTVVSCPDAAASLDAPLAEKLPTEIALAVRENSATRGYLFISVNTTVPIDVLDCELSFDGGYIRRVYVDQTHRNRGVATALITAANRYAAALGATQTTALVAIDNRPSQALFETCDFRARRTRLYARVGPVSIRRQLPTTQ